MPKDAEQGSIGSDTIAHMNETIEPEAKPASWLDLLLAAIAVRIPSGYEDEDGFHFGAEPR